MEKSQAKYKVRHDKDRVDHHFHIGDKVWLTIRKDRLKGEGNKCKPIRYAPFTILDKIGTNTFRLDLPPYMQIYAVVNIEYLHVRLKGMHLIKAKWMEIGKVREIYPHLFSES